MKILIPFLLFLVLIACNEQQSEPEIIGDNNSASSDVGVSKFQKTQDSILKSYSSAIKLINQIDDELTKLSNVPQTIETQNLERDILQKIEYLSFQLRAKNDEIDILESRVKALGKENKKYEERINTLEAILVEKDKIMENQKERISSLENQLKIVIQERDFAMEGKQSAEKFATETTNQKNTAYYVIGTEEDLEKRNVISMEGEGFLGIGGRYVPSVELNLGLFKRIDISIDTLLSFPGNFQVDQVVSTHNKKFLEIVDSPTGDSFMKIKNHEEFWKTDKTLILIVKKKK